MTGGWDDLFPFFAPPRLALPGRRLLGSSQGRPGLSRRPAVGGAAKHGLPSQHRGRWRGKSEAQQAARPVPDDTEDWAGPAGMAEWLWFNCRALSLPGLPGKSREGRKNGKRGRSCTKSCTSGLHSRRAPPEVRQMEDSEGGSRRGWKLETAKQKGSTDGCDGIPRVSKYLRYRLTVQC